MIDEERDYVDERLCGVNNMTFKEWECYQDQMLRYYSVYQYDNELYREAMETIHQKKMNHRTKTMNGMRTIEVAFATTTFVKVVLLIQDGIQARAKMMSRTTRITNVFVCVIPPILMQELAVVATKA